MGSTSKPQHIKLKDEIAGTLGDQRAIAETPGRTTDRDEAAAWLLENVIETGEWPLSYNELADRSKWSAGHFRNTYERYFERATNDGDGGDAGSSSSTASAAAGAAGLGDALDTGGMSIDIRHTVSDMESFIAGIKVGYELAKDEQQ